ncbi:MAG: hypothetical protein AAGD32_15280 [Planctomycetota bacterium]
MSLADRMVERLDRSVGLYRELPERCDRDALGSKLPGLPSNTIGAQLWCVVGARESYVKSIAAGRWSGFSCSLAEPGHPERVREALTRSEEAAREAVSGLAEFDATRQDLVVSLLEHEAAHQGQLIRYLYGLRLPIPDGWKRRYALD